MKTKAIYITPSHELRAILEGAEVPEKPEWNYWQGEPSEEFKRDICEFVGEFNLRH